MLTKPVRLQHIEAALEAVGLVLVARAGAGSSAGSSLASPTTPTTPATPAPTLTLGAAGSASRGAAPASPGFSFSFSAKAPPP